MKKTKSIDSRKTSANTRHVIVPLLLDCRQAAEALNICTATIRARIDDGSLKAIRFSGGRDGRWRIPVTEVQRVAAEGFTSK